MSRLADCLPWIPPALHLAGALAATLLSTRCWPVLALATRVAFATALLGLALRPDDLGPGPIVATLVTFLGWIIGDYSRRYLKGEPGQARFAIAFLTTLAAVGTVVASTNFAILIAAWALGSVGLHHLLTFYRERPAALLVAHKKFLTSRLAEGLLVAAALLLYREWGTLDLPTLAQQAEAAHSLSWQASAAALLIAAAVALKSAQLPFHGWLIQVMEAPTPVSALLHAGVVNLGGFVLIRFAPLIGASPAAQSFLVGIGSLTAVLAGLVMLTRVTIKVRLAWSTCSQMGFMLMECGLGLYDLALLHLVAHALYKAHAFLTAGAVLQHGANSAGRLSFRGPLLALPAAGIIATGSAALWHLLPGFPPMPWISTTLLSIGLATLLWPSGTGPRFPWKGLLAVGVTVQCYIGWHLLFTRWTEVPASQTSPLLAAGVLALFLALYVAQAHIWMTRQASPASRLYDLIYAGLYLDEWFTRFTFQIWPPETGTARNRST